MHDFPASKIGSLPCAAVDLVLAATFDWRELHNLLASCGESAEAVCPAPLAEEDRTLVAAHALAHRHGRFARRLDAMLDALYGDFVVRVRAAEPPRLAWSCLREPLPDTAELAALVWAVLTDARPALAPLGPLLLARANLAAWRARRSTSEIVGDRAR